MSLHTLAHHVQSAGRGDDKVLVHMTPGEVKGLQSIAMAHGGSLTINPQTGLPEAGFLSSILPMLAGGALTVLSGGAINPLTAGFLIGGGTAVATGDLKKGLMAGLGAYGGAGLGSGLMAQGAAESATAATLNPSAAGQVGLQANTNMLASPATNVADDVALESYRSLGANTGGVGLNTLNSGVSPYGLNTAYTPAQLNAMGASSTSTIPTAATPVEAAITNVPRPVPPMGGATVTTGAGGMQPAFNQSAIPRYVPSDATTSQLFAKGTPLSPTPTVVNEMPAQSTTMSQLGRGIEKSFTSTEGLKGLYNAMPTGSVAATGLTLAEGLKPEYKAPAQTTSLIRPYEFDYGTTNVSAEPYSGSAERTYFNPVFTAKEPYEAPGPEYAAEGGLMGYAVGGPIEQMAAMNAVGANTGYPMANLQTSLYANPAMQRPEAMNVVAPSADVGVGAYTGEARFAKGGAAEPESSGYSYSYDPKTMQFTQLSGPGEGGIQFGGINLTPASFALTQKQYDAARAAQQPTTPNGTVSGGMVQPVTQPAAPAQPLIPNINIPAYQTPEQQLGLGGFYDYMNQQLGGYGGYAAGGGVSHLGGYSDGGRLLDGPGDGVSDSIPASIGNRQPARLADGEFVVPARIVSELGNGSTKAGAKKLYAMMDRVQNARKKSVGKDKVAVNSRADKYLPA